MKYQDCKSPEEYLENVLDAWKTFNVHNGGFCKAIRDLLDKYYALKKEVTANE